MLSEMKINDYIDLLASDAPAPGASPFQLGGRSYA